MDAAQLSRAFAATVQASLHGLQSLEPVLNREQAALAGRDPDALGRVVNEKLQLLKEIEPSVTARDRLLTAAGLQDGLDGGTALVASLGDATLQREWQGLLELARRVADLNDQNAQLTMQNQRATRTALGILTGRPASDDTYSTLRRKGRGVASYTLGKV